MRVLPENLISRVDAITHPVTQRKLISWRSILLWHLAVPLAFVIIVFFFFPYSEQFEFSTDEGINLMKAMLVKMGYPLYSQIWSDQPPLFTYMLALVFNILGLKVGAGRFLVLLLSSGLIWAAFQFMRLVWGNGYALAAALLLFLLPKYMILSVAVMVGLPALAFAMVSLFALALWHKQRKPIWLILSALALGTSVLVKLFTGILAPIFVFGLLAAEFTRIRLVKSWRKIIGPAFLWGLIFTGFVLALGLTLVGPGNVSQLIEPHLAATTVPYFRDSEILTINWHLRQGMPILFLAVVGAIITFQSKKWLTLYPLAWMVTAYIFLDTHTPVWDHQQLLVTIPAAMLGGIAVYEGGQLGYQMIQSYYTSAKRGLLRTLAFLGLFVLVFTFRTQEPISLLSPTPSLTNSNFEIGPLIEKFFTKMTKFAPETHWVVTDLPMYAFRARLPVPPNLAVFSQKRVETGNLTEEQLLETIKEWNPEQVLLGRFQFPRVEAYLRQNYRIVHATDNIKLYIRRDLGGS